MGRMINDPTDPNYDSAQSNNEPVDHDEDQLAQDAGSQVGYGEEASSSEEESKLQYEMSEKDDGNDPTEN